MCARLRPFAEFSVPEPSRLWRRMPVSPAVRGLTLVAALCSGPAWGVAIDPCENRVYLTFNTGAMDNAPQVAEVLQRHHVRATFFAANVRTLAGDGSLGNYWAPWWKARGSEGHQFASLTYDHVFWRADLPGTTPRYRVRLTSGAFEGREFSWEAGKYCEQIAHAAQRLSDFTGKRSLPLFRAPGGTISPGLVDAARGCGYAYVAYAPTAVLDGTAAGDKPGADAVLQRLLRDIRSGDILLATLGGSNAPATSLLEGVILGLRERGFCFDTLRAHPDYQNWIVSHAR